MKKIIVISIITLLIFVPLFYWYQVRPSNIRSKCNNEAVDKTVDKEITEGILRSEEYNGLSIKEKEELKEKTKEKIMDNKETFEALMPQDDYKFFYEQCLKSNGINK